MEDVSFMKEHGEPETQVVFVDSSHRDVAAYPDCAEYTIPFDQPIRNVVGVDVLDSVVPSTMYTVDEHNRDLLAYFVGAGRDRGRGETSHYLRWLLALERPATDALAPGHVATGTQTGRVHVVDERYGDAVDTHLVDVPGGPPLDRVVGVRLLDRYPAGAGAPPDSAVVVTVKQRAFWVPKSAGWGAERFLFDEVDGRAVMVVVAKRAVSDADAAVRVACQRLRFPVGNFTTISALVTAAAAGDGTDGGALTTTGTDAGVPYLQPVSANADRLQKVRVSVAPWSAALDAAACLVAIDCSCGLARVLGATGAPRSGALLGRFAAAGRTFLTNQPAHAAPAPSLDLPGIVNLTGERYVIMRCPEVEAGMYSSGSYGSRGTGIGLFRLSLPGALSEQRQDYVTVVKRPFHPIARLDQLTLRFERGSSTAGALYDFKGVDHLLVLAIKFMVTKRPPPGGSVLNPNYERNFVDYQLKHLLAARHDERLGGDALRAALRTHETLLAAERDALAGADAGTGTDSGYSTDSSDRGAERYAPARLASRPAHTAVPAYSWPTYAATGSSAAAGGGE